MKYSQLLFMLGALVTGFVPASIASASPHFESVEYAGAIVVTPQNLGRVEQKAVDVLREEIQRRSGLTLKQTTRWPESGTTPIIAIGLHSQLADFAGPFSTVMKRGPAPATEGYSLTLQTTPRPAVIISGGDPRGVLFGVGMFLRKAEIRPQSILIPAQLRVSTAPKYEIRAQQLGYRPKVNAYDAWTVEQFDHYIRELALFGVNAIEIMVPRTDDEPTNPLMKYLPMEMMETLARVIDSYGLDVWIWCPNMGADFTSEEGIKKELAERDEIFRRVKPIKLVFVPAGDPGSLHPDVYFPWLGKMSKVLNKHHPDAKIWISAQAFQPTREWMNTLIRYVNEKPSWLGGVGFGAWTKETLPELRARFDKDVKFRHHPDITHCMQCMYPVPNWDLAYALTLGREPYNPRPAAMKTIHNLFAAYTCGSRTYSEGINDDLNKFVWSDQDWNPEMSAEETVRDYCRLFISPDFSEDIATGYLALEKNWQGPLAINRQVDVTLQQWRQMETTAPAAVTSNYRFQMGLLRAYYDAYVRTRLINETALESRALDTLRAEAPKDVTAAMSKAEEILDQARTQPVAVDYKRKCEALADSLFEKIGSQLTVKKHGGQHRRRGAFMDGIDEPLNNIRFLRAQFRQMRGLPSDAARLERVDQIVNRTNPGPGGFYDSFGDPGSEKRIVNSTPWEKDPGSLKSPRITFYSRDLPEDMEDPLAWVKQVRALYETPLRIAYDDLDPTATYSLRASYSGRTSQFMRLVADDRYVIAEKIESRKPVVQEFPIPWEATKDGRLELEWSAGEGQTGSEVAEVWLIRKSRDVSGARRSE